jgi:hypothetical protein
MVPIVKFVPFPIATMQHGLQGSATHTAQPKISTGLSVSLLLAIKSKNLVKYKNSKILRMPY